MANLKNTIINDTGHITLPIGTVAQRPATPTSGMTRFNTATSVIEFFNGEIWIGIGLRDGSSQSSAAVSAQAIKTLTGTNTDGTYWIELPGVGATLTYCIMNSAINDGGWMMMLKATRGNTFEFLSSYWTTSNTLNVLEANRNDGDAKFEVMNRFAAKDMLALWPDLGQGGCISASGYPFIWLQNDFYGGTRIVPITFWNTVDRYFLGDANNFCGIANFSRQTDVRFYGFNYRNNQGTGNGTRTRWGFGWNENGGGLYPNGNMDSDDVAGGIGMNGVQQNTGTKYSAGDVIGCCSNVTGMNRSARVELYVR